MFVRMCETVLTADNGTCTCMCVFVCVVCMGVCVRAKDLLAAARTSTYFCVCVFVSVCVWERDSCYRPMEPAPVSVCNLSCVSRRKRERAKRNLQNLHLCVRVCV